MKDNLIKDGRVRSSGPLTKKERDALKIKIANFCEKPRTYKEVSSKFRISGISAAGLLKDYMMFDYDRETKTFQKKEQKRKGEENDK